MQHNLYVNNLVCDVKANPRASIGTSIVTKNTINVFRPSKEEDELVLQIQKLNRLRNLMVCLRLFSTEMNIVRSHFSVGRPLSWMTLLFQKGV